MQESDLSSGVYLWYLSCLKNEHEFEGSSWFGQETDKNHAAPAAALIYYTAYLSFTFITLFVPQAFCKLPLIQAVLQPVQAH